MAPTIGFVKKLTSKLSRSSSNSKSKNTLRKKGKKGEQSENNENPKTRRKRASSNNKPSREGLVEKKTAAQTPPSPDTVSTEGKKSAGQAAKKSGIPKLSASSLCASSDMPTSPNVSREAVSATEEISSGMDTCDYDQPNSDAYIPTVVLSVKNEEREQATETKERSKENDKQKVSRTQGSH